MKYLITGGYGFVGQHLLQTLEDGGDVVVTDSDRFNVLNYEQIRSFLFLNRPDVIFHMAAISYVPSSWQDSRLVMEVNTIGTLNLFNAVRSVGIEPTILIAGSSEEYGMVYQDELPITENNPLRPLSPYGVSKCAMDLLGYQYFNSYGMKIIRTRAFNQEGYGRPELFMPSGFVKQAVEYKKGLRQTIKHGDLESRRDITDVRDMVNAYKLAVMKCKPGEVYNIGTGIGYSGREILDKILKICKIDAPTEKDPKRMRPSDVPTLVCDSTKFRKLTGWKPEYDIEDTLKEEIRYWEKHV